MTNLLQIVLLSASLAAFLFGVSPSLAQSIAPNVLTTAGGSTSAGNFYLDWTLGQAWDVQTLGSGSFVVTQGYQQPAQVVTAVAPGAIAEPVVVVFPNPADAEFSLRYSFVQAGSVSLRVFDLTGKLIRTDNLGTYTTGEAEQTIPADELSAGIYMLQVLLEPHTGGKPTLLTRKLQVVH